MDELLAHSAKNGAPAQTYEAHIRGVSEKAARYAKEAENYAADRSGALSAIVGKSALLHDLGKLDPQNQEALRRPAKNRQRLPVKHADAGSAALKNMECCYSAMLVYAHHGGLPDIQKEHTRGPDIIFREKEISVRTHTDETLEDLLRKHQEIFPDQISEKDSQYGGDQPVFFRMALSCLADADHTDTAAAYGQAPEQEHLPQLCAKKRLVALNQYVNKLGGDDERSRLRREMYAACRDAKIEGGIATCDSPVGSGKTTAVMAHLLQQAIRRNARRIFVVLPYTSIIHQSVKVYRQALTLSGENSEEVVAELHSRADFQSQNTWYLTSLWRAPIVVTTAVAFFETLASNQPSTLRRLHELPGSMIFVDEAHNALPLKLLPLAWNWMNTLANEWSCYWLLASGSLVRYWELERLSESAVKMPCPQVAELVNSTLRERLMTYEHNRIAFCWRETPVSRQELIDWVQSVPGPRLIILNTVQNAAVIASDLCKKTGRASVEHLSTALTPEDRNKVIDRIKQRLSDDSDTDWTLVATSCVEAGVDFSFRTGFREISSLLSLLQAAGRVNRQGDFANAEMWSFDLRDDSALTRIKEVECSAAVLRGYFRKGFPIVPELSTRSMNDEIIRDDSCIKEICHLMEQEEDLQFLMVKEVFKVIDADTVPAVIDATLAEEIAAGKSNWHTLQKKALSIHQDKIKTWHLQEIAEGVYRWTLEYDDFLGYMRGVLNMSSAPFARKS